MDGALAHAPPLTTPTPLARWRPALCPDGRAPGRCPQVLGATNPAEAAVGSVRREILEKFTELGLASKPNTGENGVHASASPFEALAERINWTGATISSDPFGRGMLAAGVPAETIKAWADDPQVSLGGQRGSLFDLLEDVDADTVLSMSAKIKPA